MFVRRSDTTTDRSRIRRGQKNNQGNNNSCIKTPLQSHNNFLTSFTTLRIRFSKTRATKPPAKCIPIDGQQL